nr:polysaccharide biosynthesis C-terminal domain-containing protein [Gemmatimonadota bacterium]
VLINGAGLGMEGAAWATVTATGVQAAVYLRAIRRGLACGWGEILPWKELGRTLAVAGLFFLPLAMLRFTTVSGPLVVAIAIAWGAVYLALVVLPRLRAVRE